MRIGLAMASLIDAIAIVDVGSELHHAVGLSPSCDVGEVNRHRSRQVKVKCLSRLQDLLDAAGLLPANFLACDPFGELEHVLHAHAAR